MNALQLFNFETNDVRIIDRDGEPWFVLADVCKILGLENPSKAAQGLEEDERNTLTLSEGIRGSVRQRGNPNATIISFPGLMRLVARSDKPVARRFQRWLFHEALPALFKTGHYEMPGVDCVKVSPVAPKGDRGNQWVSVDQKFAALREGERLFGLTAAQRLWYELGFPDPGLTEDEKRALFTRSRASQPDTPTVPTVQTSVQMDAMAQAKAFVADCLSVDQSAVTPAADVRRAYLDWCVEADVAPLSPNAIGAAMTQLGYAKEKRGGTVRYLGVKVVVTDCDFAEFVRSACETGPAFMASSMSLFDVYRSKNPGSKATLSAFGRWLTSKGYPVIRKGDHKWRRGLRLNTGVAANGQ